MATEGEQIDGAADAPQMTFDQLLDHPDTMQLIAFSCDAQAALALSATCSRAPRFKLIASPVQETSGDWHGPSHVYSALPWQKLSLQSHATRLHTVYVACSWRDQGWGNRKGMLSVVAGEDGEAPGDYQPWQPCVVAGREPAPHELSPLRLEFKPEIDTAAGGWLPYRLFARVGGGGGHSLCVRHLAVRELRLVLPGEAVEAAAIPPPTNGESVGEEWEGDGEVEWEGEEEGNDSSDGQLPVYWEDGEDGEEDSDEGWS